MLNRGFRAAVAVAAMAWAGPLMGQGASAGVPVPDRDRVPDGARPLDRRMAITIDDLPVAAGVPGLADKQAVTERLLAVLRAHEVPAVGFVNESKLEVDGRVDPRRVRLLERWLEEGQELGNHGHSHLDLHGVAPEVWMEDVLRGERVTRPLARRHGEPFRYFRHPFLHTGMSVEVQRRTGRFLEENGYRIAPVTIDNGEYFYGGAYAGAWERSDSVTMRRIGRDYVRYMLDVTAYYERQAEAIVEGDDFPQVLLIHAYALNADWLAPLLEALRDRGWRWIELDEALRHPAYERPVDGWTGRGGITWLHRWAITADMDRSIFLGEPEVPAWVVELYERR